jgi:hypothetical protein
MTHRWARSGATSTENALVHSIELLPVFLGLEVFTLCRWVVVLQEWLNGLVLLAENQLRLLDPQFPEKD